MCYLRQVELDPQNRIYSNEALSGEKPRVLGTLVDPSLDTDPPLVKNPPLVTDPLLDTDPTLVKNPPLVTDPLLGARHPVAGLMLSAAHLAPPPHDQEGSLWKHLNLCSLF